MTHSPPLEQRQLERLLADMPEDFLADFERQMGRPARATEDDLIALGVDGHAFRDVRAHNAQRAAAFIGHAEWLTTSGRTHAARDFRRRARSLLGLSGRRGHAATIPTPPTRPRGAGRPRAQATRRSSTSRDDGDDGDDGPGEPPASPSGEVAL